MMRQLQQQWRRTLVFVLILPAINAEAERR